MADALFALNSKFNVVIRNILFLDLKKKKKKTKELNGTYNSNQQESPVTIHLCFFS